ncbi:hypothetical protein JS533_009820 [Bifidobacterium amazonense]|uniref:Large polyvalent protein associated domain-containing protein n=1 Tax=Bifidobacterium amazonense TaxID=2809027 RepID=A0ABS9VX56_9BIFI|nr:hypothetical protein [Bifidobacterium amazonense]MCH9276559.1 hypothetical protein [Bifidobacterium amazonense]
MELEGSGISADEYRAAWQAIWGDPLTIYTYDGGFMGLAPVDVTTEPDCVCRPEGIRRNVALLRSYGELGGPDALNDEDYTSIFGREGWSDDGTRLITNEQPLPLV